MARMHSNYLPVETHYLPIPTSPTKRRVRVLLPSDYQENSTATYPVVYMQDGQNVFYSKEAYSGHSWKLIPLIKQNPDFPKLIVVALDNGGEQRFDEYTPWTFESEVQEIVGFSGGSGELYSQWVVEQVKPFIDQQYRTKADRAHTVVAGSSLGGIIAAYIGAKYPEIFGSLGVFSLASWISEGPFLDFVFTHALHPETKVYIQVGTAEGNEVDQAILTKSSNQAYIDSSLWYYQTLIRTGHSLDKMWLRVLADEQHFEKYWADHFGEFLAFSFYQV